MPAIFLVTGQNEVLAKVLFLHPTVILFSGGCDNPCQTPHSWHGEPSRSRHTPLGMENPPRRRHTPPEQTPPGWRTPPPRVADSGIRSTIGRYASYWNAFLFATVFDDGLRSVYSTSNDAYIHFRSDGPGTASGFELRWEQITGKLLLTDYISHSW